MRVFCVSAIISCAIYAQAPAADTQGAQTPPAMKPEPKLTDIEREHFLKTAEIVSRAPIGVGTTGSERATLNDGKLAHDVQIQYVNVFKPVFEGAHGTVEKNFRDTYKFNIAAYRVAKLLGLDNVPMSVERAVDGKLASVTWWVDNVWMTEAERRDKGIKPPASQFWVDQINIVKVFDRLIHNTDRNQENLLITPEWKIYMIDHTRAFRTSHELLKPELLSRIDHELLQRLKQFNTVTLKAELGGYLRPEEIAALLARRDKIVEFFEKEISTKGKDAVLTGMPRSTPVVAIP
jgi:hypothetical protein